VQHGTLRSVTPTYDEHVARPGIPCRTEIGATVFDPTKYGDSSARYHHPRQGPGQLISRCDFRKNFFR
jgi:hypothetical protein